MEKKGHRRHEDDSQPVYQIGKWGEGRWRETGGILTILDTEIDVARAVGRAGIDGHDTGAIDGGGGEDEAVGYID